MENEKQIVVKSDEQKEVGQPQNKTLAIENLYQVNGELIESPNHLAKIRWVHIKSRQN
jgi:hypothetical protein